MKKYFSIFFSWIDSWTWTFANIDICYLDICQHRHLPIRTLQTETFASLDICHHGNGHLPTDISKLWQLTTYGYFPTWKCSNKDLCLLKHSQLARMSTWIFAILDIYQLGHLPTWKFDNLDFCQHGHLSTRLFPNLDICQ